MLVSLHRGPPRGARGFTLIELLIGLVITVLLILLAAPNYATWTADAQIRNGAESVVAGMRFAYAEAIKRNRPIEFVINPTTGSGGWIAQPVGGPAIQQGYFSEASKLAGFTTTPGGATTVTFTGLGTISATNADASAVLTVVDVTFTGPISGSRPLRILVGGGRTGIKLCDPAVSSTTSPRYCTV